MRYGPSRHFAAVAKKRKSGHIKSWLVGGASTEKKERSKSFLPPLHQEKETFVEMAVANGTSYCE